MYPYQFSIENCNIGKKFVRDILSVVENILTRNGQIAQV